MWYRKDTTQKYKKQNPKNKEKRQKTEQKSSKQTNWKDLKVLCINLHDLWNIKSRIRGMKCHRNYEGYWISLTFYQIAIKEVKTM